MKKTVLKRMLIVAFAISMIASLSACQETVIPTYSSNSSTVSDLHSESSQSFSETSAQSSEGSVTVISDYVDESSESAVESSETRIDPFENVALTFTGTAPYISASVDTTKCSDAIKDNIEFTVDKSENLRNGDEITVTAGIMDTAESSGFSIDPINNTKTFVVENQPEYITDVEGLDLKELQSEIDDKFSAFTTTNKGDHWFAGVGVWNFDSVSSTTVKSKYMISLKKQFEDKQSSSKPYNEYLQINEYVVNKTQNEGQMKIYVVVTVNGLKKEADGSVSFDLDYGAKGYDSYENLINDYVNSQKEFYNIVKIQ